MIAEADFGQATVLAAVVIGNIGLIIGSYVSMKVSITRLEVKVDALSEDTDALWKKYRNEK